MAANLADHFHLVIKIPVGRIPKQRDILLTHQAPPGYGHSAGMKEPCNPRKNPAQT